jgi:hypothetical protein
MTHRSATILGFASAFVLAVLPCGTASAQCEATEDSAIVHSDTQIGDQLGNSVAIDGDVVVVGAPQEDEAANTAGAVYVFRANGGSWFQEQKLMAGDADSMDYLGTAVAVKGSVAVAGAPQDEQAGTLAGSAYVFRFNGTQWVQEQKLLPSPPPVSSGFFGTSVALNGDVVAIGAPMTGTGKVYVFRYMNNQWSQEDVVTAIDAAAGDRFGMSVALGSGVLLVGANRDDDDGTDSGSVYVFTYQGIDGWVHAQKLTATDGQAGAGFGFAVSMSGNAALIGANNDVAPPWDAGSAYVFRYDGLSWNEEQKFPTPIGSPSQTEFGFSVDIDGDVALVGSLRDDGAEAASGGAWLYAFDGNAWNQQAMFQASDGGSNDQFGRSVALGGGVAVVGARDHQPGGAGYLMAGLADGVPDACNTCPWDMDGGGVGITDFLSVLSAWGSNPGGPPDFDGNGSVGITDFLEILSHWGPCP